MTEQKENCDFSVILNEVNRLSNELNLMLTDDEIRDFDEIKTLREILCEIQEPKLLFYTDS